MSVQVVYILSPADHEHICLVIYINNSEGIFIKGEAYFSVEMLCIGASIHNTLGVMDVFVITEASTENRR